jgi:RHS repeat-associated protein
MANQYAWDAGAGQWNYTGVSAYFYYDADGQRVRKDDVNGITAYAGAHFELNVTTYAQRATYSFNGQVVAVRNITTTTWLHSDHLGSTSMATDVTGAVISGSETRYTPWGEVRVGGMLPTDRGFTSQRREATIGLSDYVARFYDPYIGKFVSPDSIVPGPQNPQAFNRYSYAFNSPLVFVDPTGHDPDNSSCSYAGDGCADSYYQVLANSAYGSSAFGMYASAAYQNQTFTGWNSLSGVDRSVFAAMGLNQSIFNLLMLLPSINGGKQKEFDLGAIGLILGATYGAGFSDSGWSLELNPRIAGISFGDGANFTYNFGAEEISLQAIIGGLKLVNGRIQAFGAWRDFSIDADISGIAGWTNFPLRPGKHPFYGVAAGVSFSSSGIQGEITGFMKVVFFQRDKLNVNQSDEVIGYPQHAPPRREIPRSPIPLGA